MHDVQRLDQLWSEAVQLALFGSERLGVRSRCGDEAVAAEFHPSCLGDPPSAHRWEGPHLLRATYDEAEAKAKKLLGSVLALAFVRVAFQRPAELLKLLGMQATGDRISALAHVLTRKGGMGQEQAWVVWMRELIPEDFMKWLAEAVIGCGGDLERADFARPDPTLLSSDSVTSGGMASAAIASLVEETAQYCGLTEREREVLASKVLGYSGKEIGERLGIREGTVGAMWHKARKKLQRLAG